MVRCSTRSIDLLRDGTKSRHLLSRWPVPRAEAQKVLRSAGTEGSVLSGIPRLGDQCLRARDAALWRIPVEPLQKLCAGHQRPGLTGGVPGALSGRSFLLCLLFAAQRPPSRRPARPRRRCGRAPGGGGGGQRGRDGAGVVAAARALGRSRADTARTAATFAPRSWLHAPAQICGRQEGPPERDSVVRACRQASPSGAEAPATQTSDPAPAPQPPATSPGARTTMGPTLALPALLLLLLLPPPSLSQDEAEKVVPTAGQPEVKTTVPVDQSSPDPPTTTATASTVLTKATAGNPETVTSSPTQTTTAPSPKEARGPGQSSVSTTTLPPGSADSQSGDDSGRPTTPSGSQGDKMITGRPPSDADPTSSTEQPVPSGGKSSDNVTTAPPATQGSDQITTPASQTPDPLATAKSPPASTTVSTASPHSPVATPSQTTEDHSTVVFNSSGPVLSPPDFSVSPGKLTMHTPLGTTKGTPPTTIQMPGVFTLPVSTPRQTTGSPMGTETVPTAEEFTQSSSHWTPTAPQGPSTSSPVWTLRNYKLKCEAPMMPSEELLILNLTGASLCEGNSPDEKLVEMLCHSVKASFKPAQDQCTLQLAPILGSRAVVVKRVTIETKLPPKVVYELLKDKWDDLKEAGVSDMMLGSEGPPETNEDRFSLPLIITIVCMASFLLLVAALYGCCHQRISQRKDQQRLTEELQTVENGYHDNPTLEVMETPSEMQEKKVVNLNGELGDSWIVPLDNLTKDDLDEEDTHL
ncbi:podocalyxin [Chionomys nivalis]|uniref:podocalyxin n=1 Tax=Chionomys nivalis TaxID=269649 RepID=UPI002597793F|nr:podocalyxin [Chionomys nivalis]